MNDNIYYPNYSKKEGYYPEMQSNYVGVNQTLPKNYIEDNLKNNLGKTVTFHMSFPDSEKERDMTFNGKIQQVARDHVIIQDQNSNIWYLLPLLYLNYIETSEIPNLF